MSMTAALKQIADMDPEGIRADDLGRAARIAREALASSGQAASVGPELTEDQAAALDKAFERMRDERDGLKARLFEALKSDPILKRGLEEVDHAMHISRGIYSQVLDVACAQKARADEAEAKLAALSSGQAASAVPELTDARIDDLASEWVYIRSSTESEQYAELRRFARAVLAASPTQPASAPAREGEVVVTKDEAGAIVAVTRQDDEGRILSVIAEATPAAPTQPRADEPMEPFLVRDIAAELGRSVPEVCIALREAGLGDFSTNAALTRKAALAVRERLAPRAPSIEPVGEAPPLMCMWAGSMRAGGALCHWRNGRRWIRATAITTRCRSLHQRPKQKRNPIMADAQMQFLYESAGRRWYFAAPGHFERPGIYFWNGKNNVHVDDALAAPASAGVEEFPLPTADEIAQQIRMQDGAHRMGAAALGEALHEWLRSYSASLGLQARTEGGQA